MSFQTFMEACLPPKNNKGAKPHISGSTFLSYRNRPSTNNTHAAVDFNYTGGQANNPKGKFPVYTPVSGTIVLVSPKTGDGAVHIRDSAGVTHQFLHMSEINVRNGSTIQAGTYLGKMNGIYKGRPSMDCHMHYKITVNGKPIDPVAFHDKTIQVYTGPLATVGLEETEIHDYDPNKNREEPADPQGFIDEFAPKWPGISSVSGAQRAVWTNRVPTHEPWARVMMGNTLHINAESDEYTQNVNHAPQLDPDSDVGAKLIGKLEGDEYITRGPFWRR